MADLVIAGIGIPDAADRGVTQTLQPIGASQHMARTVNAELIDLSAPEFRKFASQIRCRDQNPPALSGVWPGVTVTVDCIAEMTAGPGHPAERPIVSSRVEGDWTIYKPRLVMKVVKFDLDCDKWGAAIGWTLDLEEV